MENDYTNTQKFWLSFMAILMIGLGGISFCLMGAWINTPTDWSITINTDNNTKEIFYSINEMQNTEKIQEEIFIPKDITNIKNINDIDRSRSYCIPTSPTSGDCNFTKEEYLDYVNMTEEEYDNEENWN